MRNKKKAPEESSGGSAPAYIVTFSDMITLLLTFFVMLLSMAETQTEITRFEAGIGSFKRAVADFGLSGMMFSKHSGANFSYPKIKYKVNQEKDETEERSVDSQTEMLQRLIMDIEQMMKISPSHIVGASDFTVTDIHFEPGSWTLNKSAKQFLTKYSSQMQESFAAESPSMYIVGLADSESLPKQQWIVSARRAQAVTDFMKNLLSKSVKWPLYSWGAGTGGDWTGDTGMLSKQTHIMIAVLTKNTQ